MNYGAGGIWLVASWFAVFGFLLLLLFGRSMLVGQPGLVLSDLVVAGVGATISMVLPWIVSFVASRRVRREWRSGGLRPSQSISGHASGGMDRFDAFTDDTRRALTLAQEEGSRFNHHYIGTEHVLLGLLRVPESVAARVLTNMHVDISKVRMAVEFIIGHGQRPVVGEVGLTHRAKRVIELAIDEARTLGHGYVGTEHLLLGLVREGEGIAAGVLQSLGINLDRLRAEVLAELKRKPG
jgi:hypothetical protein